MGGGEGGGRVAFDIVSTKYTYQNIPMGKGKGNGKVLVEKIRNDYFNRL